VSHGTKVGGKDYSIRRRRFSGGLVKVLDENILILNSIYMGFGIESQWQEAGRKRHIVM